MSIRRLFQASWEERRNSHRKSAPLVFPQAQLLTCLYLPEVEPKRKTLFLVVA